MRTIREIPEAVPVPRPIGESEGRMVDRFFIDSYGVESIDKLGKWVLYIDHKQALAEKDQKYQQLMAQAVRVR